MTGKSDDQLGTNCQYTRAIHSQTDKANEEFDQTHEKLTEYSVFVNREGNNPPIDRSDLLDWRGSIKSFI